MADPTAAPPVSPAEGTPVAPDPETTENFLKALEAEHEQEKHARMARYVPPVMQAAFLEKFPPPPAYTTPPTDEEDIRQAASKRGEPAPNEPKEYIDAQGNTIDPTKLPEPVEATPAPAEPVPPYTPPPSESSV